jgi:hypothetical protein
MREQQLLAPFMTVLGGLLSGCGLSFFSPKSLIATDALNSINLAQIEHKEYCGKSAGGKRSGMFCFSARLL